MAVTINSKWYVSSAGWSAITAWTSATAMTVGMIRRQTAPAVASERVFVCTVAGTSLGTEPTWVLTKGAKTTEAAGPVWMECTGLPALNSDMTNTPLSSANRSGLQSLGNLIKNNTSTHIFICTTAGSTGAGEPTFNTTTGATTVDSGCTWTCLGAVGSFTTAWAAAGARLNPILTNTWAVGGNNAAVYVSSSHAETQATVITISRGAALSAGVNWANVGIPVLCVPNGGAIPPTSVTTGATVTSTGAAINLDVTLDIWGIAFTCPSTVAMAIGAGTNGNMRLTNCALTGWKLSVSSSSGNSSRVELVNTTMAFNGLNTGLISILGPFVWRDTPNAVSLAGAGAWPTRLFDACRPCAASLQNVDISAWAGATAMTGASQGGIFLTLDHCKIPATFPIFTTLSTINSPGDVTVDLINCDNGGVTLRHEHWEYAGSQTLSTNVVVAGGATDGTTAYSWRLATGTTASWQTPLKCTPLIVWNTTTLADVTVTVNGVYNGTALPTNDQVWLETVFFGNASSTAGVTDTSTRATPFDAAVPVDASTLSWDSAATARVSSRAYTINEVLKVSSNPGRLFICTGAGTSASSEPGGYATAVDGGPITDGTASMRAMVRFSISNVLNSPQPQAPGYVYCSVKMGLLSSILWVDPKPVLA